MSAFTAGPFSNGSAIMAERDARGRERWAIFDAAGGDPVRRMYDLDQAIAFAKALPVPADLEPILPQPALSWSHRAQGRAAELGLDAYTPVPEPEDGAAIRAMSPARARSGAGPSDRPVPAIAPRPRRET
jgi:hypothetical protein